MTTPVEIDAALRDVADQIERWSKLEAWHEAQKQWRHTILVLKEAEAAMAYTGPATKAKWYAITQSADERIMYDIAAAQHGACASKLRAFKDRSMILLGRNKNVMAGFSAER